MSPHKFKLADTLRENPTPAEAWVWGLLQEREVVWYRQVCMGGYIADFYNPTMGLVVELDGRCHEQRIEYDEKRDMDLAKLGGYMTVRFTNDEAFKIKTRDEFYEAIMRKLLGC